MKPSLRRRRVAVVLGVLGVLGVIGLSGFLFATTREPSFGEKDIMLTSTFLQLPEEYGALLQSRSIAEIRASTDCLLRCTTTIEVAFSDKTPHLSFHGSVEHMYPKFAITSTSAYTTQPSAPLPYVLRTTADHNEYSVQKAAQIAGGIADEAIKHADLYRQRDTNAASWSLPAIPSPAS